MSTTTLPTLSDVVISLIVGSSTTPTSTPSGIWASSATVTFLQLPVATSTPTASQTIMPNTTTFTPKSLSPDTKAAIAVPIVLLALLLICRSLFLYKRVGRARKAGRDEIEEHQPDSDATQKEDICFSEPTVSSTRTRLEPARLESSATIRDPTPLSELEETGAAAMTTSNAKRRVIKELDGSIMTCREAVPPDQNHPATRSNSNAIRFARRVRICTTPGQDNKSAVEHLLQRLTSRSQHGKASLRCRCGTAEDPGRFFVHVVRGSQRVMNG